MPASFQKGCQHLNVANILHVFTEFNVGNALYFALRLFGSNGGIRILEGKFKCVFERSEPKRFTKTITTVSPCTPGLQKVVYIQNWNPYYAYEPILKKTPRIYH